MQKQHFVTKKNLKLSDVAKALDVKKCIIKSWEKEFGIGSGSKQQKVIYSAQELDMLLKIKELTYVEKLDVLSIKSKLHMNNDKNDFIENKDNAVGNDKDTIAIDAVHCTMTSTIIPATSTKATCFCAKDNLLELKKIKEKVLFLKAMIIPSEHLVD